MVVYNGVLRVSRLTPRYLTLMLASCDRCLVRGLRRALLLGYNYASRIITPMMLDDLPTYCLGVTKKSRCVVRHVSQDEQPASIPPSVMRPA